MPKSTSPTVGAVGVFLLYDKQVVNQQVVKGYVYFPSESSGKETFSTVTLQAVVLTHNTNTFVTILQINKLAKYFWKRC